MSKLEGVIMINSCNLECDTSKVIVFKFPSKGRKGRPFSHSLISFDVVSECFDLCPYLSWGKPVVQCMLHVD